MTDPQYEDLIRERYGPLDQLEAERDAPRPPAPRGSITAATREAQPQVRRTCAAQDGDR